MARVLDRGARQLALLDGLGLHQETQIGSSAERITVADPFQGDAAPLVETPKPLDRLGRIAAPRQAVRQFAHRHRRGRGK